MYQKSDLILRHKGEEIDNLEDKLGEEWVRFKVSNEVESSVRKS